MILHVDLITTHMDSDGNTHLHRAVRLYRYDVVENILAHRDAKVDNENNEGETALIISVKHTNSYRLIHLLLSFNANPNIQDREGNTALHICAKGNKLSMVEDLMSFGANLDIKNTKGNLAENLTKFSAVKECIRKERRLRSIRAQTAFAMGQHGRLGEVSPVSQLDPDMRMVLKYLDTEHE